MVIMDAYYQPKNQLQEIWDNIGQLHLSYLEMEESSEKLDHRIRLEDCIGDFLSMVSHSQKFHFRQTAEVLNRSASSKNDFSGYKAATGWNAIQLYAGNLLSQPWRKEYKQIKTYCGFYKHQIEANLSGAEFMFEAMGYKNCGGGVLVLDGPICPDLVTNVSKDCLIAYVECQILKAIWENLSQNFKISWYEVLEFRKAHICSREESVKALTYQFHHKQYQAQNQTEYYNGRMSQANQIMPPPPAYALHNVPSTINPYMYGTTNYCPNNYATYGHIPPAPTNYYSTVPIPYAHPSVVKPMTNGYYGCVAAAPAVYDYTVPTGQLIELESHHNGNNYDVVDRPLKLPPPPQSNHEPKPSSQTDPEKESQLEDWDYVYRNLESQGYSKDLGERGDILSPPTSIKKHKPTNLDDAMKSLTIERNNRSSDLPGKYNTAEQRKKSPASSYENLTETRKVSPPKVATGSSQGVKNKPLREKNPNSNLHQNGNKMKKDSWQCKACTYINENSKDICEICCKSRDKIDQKMEIGGSQCSKCTLVNSKDTKICTACGASLKDSPTYI